MCVHWISDLLTSTFKNSIILKLFGAGHWFFQWCLMILQGNFSKNFSTLGEFSKDLWAKEVTVWFFFFCHSYFGFFLICSCTLVFFHVMSSPLQHNLDQFNINASLDTLIEIGPFSFSLKVVNRHKPPCHQVPTRLQIV